MKKLFAYCLILLTAGVLFHKCKPIDLTADFKDIVISYGILNPKDNVHYFKIYRGYLTDGNAYEAAGEWDNIYYPVDSIEVILEEYSNGHLVRNTVLDTTTAIPKDEGYFHNPKQLLYYTDWQLNPDNVYKMVIHRRTTGDEVYAQTLIVGDFLLRRPGGTWNMNLENPYKISFNSANNAAMYDIFLTFYYIEVNNSTGVIEHKQISRKLNGDYIRGTNGNEVNYTGFTPKSFFYDIIQGIETNPNVTRYIDSIEGRPYRCIRLTVWAANDSYLAYREVSNPGSSIVQNRLEYTNFVSDDESAYGLFASRNYVISNIAMDNTSGHNEDTLVNSPSTRRLNFDYYRNSPEFPTGPAQ